MVRQPTKVASVCAAIYVVDSTESLNKMWPWLITPTSLKFSAAMLLKSFPVNSGWVYFIPEAAGLEMCLGWVHLHFFQENVIK